MAKEVDVVVAGAGPVGLLLATELLRDGLDVLLVDPLRERSFFCKALGITPRTLEIFDDLGIAQDAIDAGVWLRAVTTYVDGERAGSMPIPTDLPFGSLSLAQSETERLLEACLRRHGGAVGYGRSLAGFATGTDGIRARIADAAGGTHDIDCRWLVGCDGAHSIVRSGIGLAYEGGQFPQTFMLADLEVDWDLTRGQFYRFIQRAAGTAEGASLVAVPIHSSGRRYRLSMVLPPEAAARLKPGSDGPGHPDLDQITGFMSPLLPRGTALSALHWSSVYRVSHLIVPAYSKGDVFLAGDAAHLHPPVGGQGMNTGLQDAHNLAWKLVQAHRGLAAPGLLESYSSERRAVGLDVVANTSRALNDVLAQRVNLPGMRETQLLVSYRGSPIVRDEREVAATAPLAAGDRAPDAGGLRQDYVGHASRLHERLGRGRHVLIGFVTDEAQASAFLDVLKSLRDRFGDGAVGFAVRSADKPIMPREELSMMIDAAGEFAAAYEARPGTAWLVRPDGHIGWCSASPTVASLEDFLTLVTAAPVRN
ncbi:MAG: FAD-dependent monooxygenase [Pseudomonadota bacterium]